MVVMMAPQRWLGSEQNQEGEDERGEFCWLGFVNGVRRALMHLQDERMIDTATEEAMAGLDARHAQALPPLCT